MSSSLMRKWRNKIWWIWRKHYLSRNLSASNKNKILIKDWKEDISKIKIRIYKKNCLWTLQEISLSGTTAIIFFHLTNKSQEVTIISNRKTNCSRNRISSRNKEIKTKRIFSYKINRIRHKIQWFLTITTFLKTNNLSNLCCNSNRWISWLSRNLI